MFARSHARSPSRPRAHRPAARALCALLVGVLLGAFSTVGCGGAAPSTNTNANANAPARRPLAVRPMSLELGGLTATLDADGQFTVGELTIGTLAPDGTLRDGNGDELAYVDEAGHVRFRGEVSELRMEGARLLGDAERGYLEVGADGTVGVFDPAGDRVDSVSTAGIVPETHATALFLIASLSLYTQELQNRAADSAAAEAAEEVATSDVYAVPVGNAPQLGRADALVTIVVFSDFQCPFCARVQDTLERVRSTYGDDVRLVFRNNPLPFHSNARPAAEAALEAYAQQGSAGFWAMHDLLFAHQSHLDRADLEAYATQLGLDLPRFRAALDQHAHDAAIDDDASLASRLGASGTPAFFINGRQFLGAQPFAAFARVIDAARTEAFARLQNGTTRDHLYDALTQGGRTTFVPPPAPPSTLLEDDTAHVWDVPVPPTAPSRGPQAAPVTIQVFSDFQCPFCSRVLDTEEELLRRYGNRVRLVFRHYPLPFHTWAVPAAELAIEVRAQRGDAAFWAFHDLVFDAQSTISQAPDATNALLALAAQIPGIDLARARQALVSRAHRAAVEADMQAIDTAGARIGTPSFFINGHLVQGAQPIDRFEAVIDPLLEP